MINNNIDNRTSFITLLRYTIMVKILWSSVITKDLTFQLFSSIWFI